MRIALDGRALNTSHVRGMGKMAFELLREASHNPELSFVLLGDEPKHPVHHPASANITSQAWEVRGHRFRAWEQLGMPLRARRLNCDVLHCLGTWCPYWQPLPVVVTIHDTLMWTEEASSVFLDRALPAAYRRARALITVSETSKRDIVQRWPELADKLVVITHGIHERYLVPAFDPIPKSLQDAGVRTPYLLYFGGEIPRKRPEWAVEVWKALGRADVQLVMCGLDPAKPPRWIDELPPDQRARLTLLGFVPEDALPSLYAHAEAVLYPTLYEGFGLPALEAQAVGTPVLMSAAGSLRELAGPGAIVLPEHDQRAWIEACRHVLAGSRPDAASARAWARGFSWSVAFEKTLAVYRSAASGRAVS
jgi:glycosyltransferase involved in cell wall biosynthesis